MHNPYRFFAHFITMGSSHPNSTLAYGTNFKELLVDLMRRSMVLGNADVFKSKPSFFRLENVEAHGFRQIDPHNPNVSYWIKPDKRSLQFDRHHLDRLTFDSETNFMLFQLFNDHILHKYSVSLLPKPEDTAILRNFQIGQVRV